MSAINAQKDAEIESDNDEAEKPIPDLGQEKETIRQIDVRIAQRIIEENPQLSRLTIPALRDLLKSESERCSKIDQEIEHLDESNEKDLLRISELTGSVAKAKQSMHTIQNEYAMCKNKLEEVEKSYCIANQTNTGVKLLTESIENFRISKYLMIFRISTSYVEINNCCLAVSNNKLPSYSEISSAFGNIVLIHLYLESMTRFSDENIKLIYNGSQSSIRVAENANQIATYPLFCSNTFRTLWRTKFDHGILYLSKYFLNLFTHIKSNRFESSKLLVLPRAILNGYIYSDSASNLISEPQKYSLLFNSNSNRTWFVAMKYFIEDINLLTLHIINNYSE